MQNYRNNIPFINFSFRKNPALKKISDETILRTIENYSVRYDNVIETLLQHDPTIRNFSISDFEKAYHNPGFGEFMANNFMAALLRYRPEVAIDQELFTVAIGAHRSSLSGLKLLLSRNPKIRLTWQLVGNIDSDAADQVVREILCSSNLVKITDNILRAALGNTYLRRFGYISPTIVNWLSKAVESLELSDETVYQACESQVWIMEKVLERWPNAPLSEESLVAALRDEQKLHILIDKRPSIEISAKVIETVYEQNRGSENIISTVLKVLELQPNTIITETLLETVSLRHTSVDGGLHRQLFYILLRRIPHANLMDNAIRRSVVYGPPLAQLTFEARPDFEISACCFGSV